ncbi:unnamed protein product [Strongylus vulgaris]|uniref:Uncharacterized protein n=1 Tax=Strongylus vulgaris TaxID=40348 RepID=A0A3P7J5E9_STRVU|nr:unnamed protein product [Strongylus vulgaris]
MKMLAKLQQCPKKLVRFEDLPNKFDLPDGYKLNGRVFGVPDELISAENMAVVNGVPLVKTFTD